MKQRQLDLNDYIEEGRKFFVTLDIFNLRLGPLEKIGYGAVTMMVIAVFSALIALVVKAR